MCRTDVLPAAGPVTGVLGDTVYDDACTAHMRPDVVLVIVSSMQSTPVSSHGQCQCTGQHGSRRHTSRGTAPASTRIGAQPVPVLHCKGAQPLLVLGSRAVPYYCVFYAALGLCPSAVTAT